ncbi:methyltransferase [uncultured Amnibacterium sp.]|uniref:DUF7059 domain-containing protein n=1 Tax=uncultured Amnibacterium sp. TaxID=1631851 RepID=UPI0035CB8785
MPTDPAAAPPPGPLVDALRADLDAAGFTVEGLAAAWGPVAAAALGRDDRVPALVALRLAPVSAVGVLGRLFVLGVPVPADDAATALPTLGVDGAVELGVLRRSAEGTEGAGATVVARIDLRPYAVADLTGVSSWWIASDLGEAALGGELPAGHVLGAGAASSTLIGILVPPGAGRVLDLGTGSGIQALHAAEAGASVVATDIAPRAIGFARLNADLNRVDLDLRLGSLYEPVAGERFDRIVSNPPFVITPRGRAEVPDYTYRDGGAVGDGLTEQVVRGAATHLVPGGIAQLLGNWEVTGDEPAARDRVLGWAHGLDAWIVQRDLLDPAEYAETWVRDGGARAGSPRSQALLRAWLTDFDARGVTAIGTGYLTLRLPASGAPTLRRFEALTEPLAGGIGAAIASGLAAHDWQAGRDDGALAAARLQVAPSVTEHRHYWPGDADPTVIELHQGTGFARRRRVDTALAAVVGACDGELTLGAIIDAVAALLQADPAGVRRAVLPQVRELLVEGFLEVTAPMPDPAV